MVFESIVVTMETFHFSINAMMTYHHFYYDSHYIYDAKHFSDVNRNSYDDNRHFSDVKRMVRRVSPPWLVLALMIKKRMLFYRKLNERV